ncbi:class I adenylate-forming enzyme family protein [Ideonella sp.]|uniref:class I adenylate-forming enzyme family protein n=1 Tax=Ideonella sp. TaxID=1929293 RepID=UPI002B46E5AB|nr:class I adenylate-forming enzyme family protein [Ideonella sp.]HJV72537.1 class I adenylate-forming enzyme family protein [Ideonella sp.]
MLLQHLFDASAAARPDQAALVFEGRRISYAELDRRAARWAAWLQRQGVQRGDRVACHMDNGIAFVLALLASLRCGAVFVPVGAACRAARLQAVLADSGACVLFGQPTLRPVTAAALAGAPLVRACLWAEPGADPTEADTADLPFVEPPTIDLDLAALIYTSGSTGEPKGVMLSHQNMLSAARSVQAYLGLRRDDVLAGVLPLAYSYGLYQVLLAFQVGACVLVERSFAFPVKVLQTLAAERATVLAAVPTMFALWLGLKNAAELAWPQLRLLTNAAAALSPEHIQRLRRLLPQAQLYSMYGMTECKRISYLPPEQLDLRPGSVGRGMPNQEHWLVDEAGHRLPDGSTGELVVRGSHVMRGYWNRPEMSAQVLRPGPLPGERVLYTGDVFRTDDEGWLYFVGRRDDIIKCRGEKVSPRAVEDALYALDGVQEAAVVGVPDPLLGQAIVAYLVPAPGRVPSEREVIRHCMDRLDNGVAPQRVVFVDTLPKTDSGKVRKADLATLHPPSTQRRN